MTELMRDGRADDRKTRGTQSGHAPRCADWDLSADIIRASSHPRCITGRIHDLHPNPSQTSTLPLANKAPSIHGSRPVPSHALACVLGAGVTGKSGWRAGRLTACRELRDFFRTIAAPATIALSLPNATARGRYFMPQSGAAIELLGRAVLRPARRRSATISGVSISCVPRSITPRITFLPLRSFSTPRSILGCALSIEMPCTLACEARRGMRIPAA